MTFPTGNSKADQSGRLTAASITLQNLNGPGKGCPVVSTTFPIQQQAINSGTSVVSTPSSVTANQPTPSPAPSPAPSPPTNSTENNNAVLDAATIEGLAPPLGFQSGINPTGTGDCDGAVNGTNGQPIKIPCSCPPPQDEYISVRPSSKRFAPVSQR